MKYKITFAFVVFYFQSLQIIYENLLCTKAVGMIAIIDCNTWARAMNTFGSEKLSQFVMYMS